jgi:hypothetical protein
VVCGGFLPELLAWKCLCCSMTVDFWRFGTDDGRLGNDDGVSDDDDRGGAGIG